MTLQRIMIFVAVFALVAGGALTSVLTRAEQTAEKPVETMDERASRVAWELFITACVTNKTEVNTWANKQVYLVSGEVKDQKKFEGMWKNIGYPLPDKLKNMWGVVDTPVWLYQHENHGCTVSSNGEVAAEELTRRLKAIAKSYDSLKGKHSEFKQGGTDSNPVQLLALGSDDNGAAKGYLMTRSFSGKEKGIKTILYYIRTTKNLAM